MSTSSLGATDELEQTAEALGVSPMTVKREWAIARAWFYERLTAGDDKTARL